MDILAIGDHGVKSLPLYLAYLALQSLILLSADGAFEGEVVGVEPCS